VVEELRAVPDLSDDELVVLIDEWLISLRSRNLSPNTLESYSTAVLAYVAFAKEHGQPTRAPLVKAEDVRAFVADQLDRLTPGSANNRFRGNAAFYRWLVDEEIIAASPMARMKAPKIPERLVPFVPEAEVKALLTACSGTGFEDRRDMGIVSVFLDTAIRRTEGMLLELRDVDLHSATITVRHGKGDKERQVGLGARTTEVLRRYLRSRRSHVHAGSPRLWLGRSGPLAETSMVAVVARRCDMAGIERISLHRLRHTALYLMKRAGFADRELGRIAGWSQSMWSEMSALYGATADTQLALERHRSNSPLDRL
jgi:site-specific recombinase XerD